MLCLQEVFDLLKTAVEQHSRPPERTIGVVTRADQHSTACSEDFVKLFGDSKEYEKVHQLIPRCALLCQLVRLG